MLLLKMIWEKKENYHFLPTSTIKYWLYQPQKMRSTLKWKSGRNHASQAEKRVEVRARYLIGMIFAWMVFVFALMGKSKVAGLRLMSLCDNSYIFHLNTFKLNLCNLFFIESWSIFVQFADVLISFYRWYAHLCTCQFAGSFFRFFLLNPPSLFTFYPPSLLASIPPSSLSHSSIHITYLHLHFTPSLYSHTPPSIQIRKFIIHPSIHLSSHHFFFHPFFHPSNQPIPYSLHLPSLLSSSILLSNHQNPASSMSPQWNKTFRWHPGIEHAISTISSHTL